MAKQETKTMPKARWSARGLVFAASLPAPRPGVSLLPDRYRRVAWGPSDGERCDFPNAISCFISNDLSYGFSHDFSEGISYAISSAIARLSPYHSDRMQRT